MTSTIISNNHAQIDILVLQHSTNIAFETKKSIILQCIKASLTVIDVRKEQISCDAFHSLKDI